MPQQGEKSDSCTRQPAPSLGMIYTSSVWKAQQRNSTPRYVINSALCAHCNAVYVSISVACVDIATDSSHMDVLLSLQRPFNESGVVCFLLIPYVILESCSSSYFCKFNGSFGEI